MADDDGLLARVHQLSDPELAILLCLVSREHAVLSTSGRAVDDLVRELHMAATGTFGLRCVVVHCNAHTTLDDFACALLCPVPSPAASQQQQQHHAEPATSSFVLGDIHHDYDATPSSHIANCVLARNLDRAPRVVQIQALELLRTRRIIRIVVQVAPKHFVFLPVLEAETAGDTCLNTHLNDLFAFAHWHDPAHGFVNLEETLEATERTSTESFVHRKQPDDGFADSVAPLVSESDVSHLAHLSHHVHVHVDIIRYQMNIISFLRMHRTVAEGISPAAKRHMNKLIRCLAPLHGLDHVTPGLVGLAIRKVYLHRIRITDPEHERSMQWGSTLEAVRAVLDGVGPEDTIQDVLGMVAAPL